MPTSPKDRAEQKLLPTTRWLVGILSLAGIITFARPAHADPPKVPQDYGAPAPSTPGGPLTVTGRVVLFPAWVLAEYALRRPIGWLVTTAEEEQLPTVLYDFFTFGDRHQVGIFPSALFDFGLLPSVGFNGYWKEALARENTVHLHFGTWGPDWVNLIASDRYQIDRAESVALTAQVQRRNDSPFYGLGPRSSQHGKVRYGTATARVETSYETQLSTSVSLRVAGGARSLGFKAGTCCGNTSLPDAIQNGDVESPPGFGNGYTALFNRLSLNIDTRAPRPAPGSGVRVEAHGEPTFAVDSRGAAGRRSWVKYGGSAGAALDLTGEQRVLALTVAAELVDPLAGAVPFVDQATLGGDEHMRGFLRGRLVDRSAVVTTLEYSWPVWVFLDGAIHVAAGNVFGERLSGFDTGAMRLSTGIGVRSNQKRGAGIEILVAAGTDPIDEGAGISSFRFSIGSHHGL
jgi:hypothetical protein